MTTEQWLFCFLRNELCGAALPTEPFSCDLIALYRLAKHHDLCHLVADALSRNGLLPEEEKLRAAFEREQLTAVYREVRLRSATDRIRAIFHGAEIPFVPLKGAVIRSMYPEPWMRTSCDIDILVHEEDLEKATAALVRNGFTTDGVRTHHDISFYCDGVHLELHFNIRENMAQIDGLLSEVWKYTERYDGTEYRETPEFFLFHHIAHMAYHFAAGGCGIRPFLDLWVLRGKGSCGDKTLLPLLGECDLVPFYRAVNDLTDVWFEGKEHTELTRQMEAYLLSGGVYGSRENSNASGAARRKGKFRYLWSVAFPPYSTMRMIYPVLQKHKILLPFCYLRRFFSKVFGKERKRVRGRWGATMNQDPKRIEAVGELLSSVGLK